MINMNRIDMDLVANDLKPYNAGEEEIPQPDPGDAPPIQPDPLKA